MAADTSPAGSAQTSGIKMLYLIRRKPETTREALVAHWFAHHMPLVIRMREDLEAAGRAYPKRYVASLFELDAQGERPWDGVAQLWWDDVLPRPEAPHGTEPGDTFQQKAEPYWPWPTREYVFMDGAARLGEAPNTLNAPYPSTRSGFYKATFLVRPRAGVDAAALAEHWLNVHAPNVRATMARVGGFRYVVSLSLEPERDPYAGMAELYFPDASAWANFMTALPSDGVDEFIDWTATVLQPTETELIGIP